MPGVNLLAVILFLVSGAVLVVMSYLTKPPAEEKMKVFVVDAKEIAVANLSDKFNVGLSILLGAIIVALWVYFSPLVFNAMQMLVLIKSALLPIS